MSVVRRREFLTWSAAASLGLGTVPFRSAWGADDKQPLFKISLAEWSLHKKLFAKEIDHLDFAKIAKEEFGIDAVEYVNQFFKDKAKDADYLQQMQRRAEESGVRSLLIMIDGEGALGDADETKRTQAVDNHKKWVEAAAVLGCHSIRVNAQSSGTYEEQLGRAADGLARLTAFAEEHNLSVIVENHGGLSSNGAWLSTVMKMVDHPHCGTLPDFGNFAIDRKKGEWYDRYQGVEELMPWAHAVSAKTHEFDKDRPFVTLDKRADPPQESDYLRMMKIVLDAGYHGYVGIEYEGSELDEFAGIRASKELLERTRDKLSA